MGLTVIILIKELLNVETVKQLKHIKSVNSSEVREITISNL